MERPDTIVATDRWGVHYTAYVTVFENVGRASIEVNGEDAEFDVDTATELRDWLTQAIAWMEDGE